MGLYVRRCVDSGRIFAGLPMLHIGLTQSRVSVASACPVRFYSVVGWEHTPGPDKVQIRFSQADSSSWPAFSIRCSAACMLCPDTPCYSSEPSPVLPGIQPHRPHRQPAPPPVGVLCANQPSYTWLSNTWQSAPVETHCHKTDRPPYTPPRNVLL